MKQIQATGNLYGETVTIKQVSKVTAKKYFAQGETVYLQSSNMRPFNMWQSVCPVQLDKEQLQADIELNQFSINLYQDNVNRFTSSNEEWSNNLIPGYEAKVKEYKEKVINAASQFESIVNNYSYYNCDSERGKYIHFYIKVL